MAAGPRPVPRHLAGEGNRDVRSRGEDGDAGNPRIPALPPSGLPLDIVKRGSRWLFRPPASFGWTLFGEPRLLALDPGAQSDFLGSLLVLLFAFVIHGMVGGVLFCNINNTV